MTFRDLARGAADTAIGFARVTASSVLSGAFSLALDLILAEDDDETGETMPEAEVYGEAALLFRPADPDADGAPETIVWRHGDERVVIATKDRRWQVELKKGDVCLRALGKNKPRLFLYADGTAVLEADEIKLGNDGATQAIGLGTAIKGHFDALKATFDAHIHTATTTATVGLAGPATVTVLAPTTTFDATPDVESRHKVEN